MGRWTEAIADYTVAIGLDPDNSEPYVNRGYAYSKREEWVRALADYGRALQLDPGNEFAFYYRALAYLDEQRWDLSWIDFYAAAQLDPDDVRVMDGRGTLYRSQGRYELAEAEFDKALALQPAYPAAVFGRALSRFAAGRFRAAAEDFASSQKFGDLEASDYLPLWLYIAHARDGRLDAAFLDGAGAKPDPSIWPGALFAFYRGQLSEEEVRTAARSTDPLTERGQRCEADFYIAEWRLLNQDKEAARELFDRAADQCPHSFIEYEIATTELKRLLTASALAQQPSAQ